MMIIVTIIGRIIYYRRENILSSVHVNVEWFSLDL